MTNLSLPPQTCLPQSAIPADDDPQETLEWLDSLDFVFRARGRERRLPVRAARRAWLFRTRLPYSPYRNTISV